MDFLKKAASGVSGNESKQGSSNAAQGGAQSQDYGDKAFDAISKKAGHDFDPATDEKITDGARGLYEKATGSKVNSKFSN